MQGVMHRRKIPAWLRLLVFLCVLSLFVSLFSVLVSVFFPVLPALSLGWLIALYTIFMMGKLITLHLSQDRRERERPYIAFLTHR